MTGLITAIKRQLLTPVYYRRICTLSGPQF